MLENIRENKPRKAHLIGICGKGMAPLAILLKEKGYEISGSDEGFYDPIYSYLKRKGIDFANGYKKENIPNDASVIIVGKHAKLVPEENEEVKYAFESGIPVKSFPEMLHGLTTETDNIVIAGSFGKSTITAIVTWCLLNANKDPSYLIGAVPLQMEDTAHIGSGENFIIEGDEYPSSNWDKTSKFLYYNPKSVVITSGEHDHLNVFPTLESYLDPFKELVKIVPSNGLIIYSKDGAHIDEIIKESNSKTVSYGLDNTTDYYATNISYSDISSFDLYKKEKCIGKFTTRLLGKHNIYNIVASCALLLERDLLTVEELERGIESFLGLSGRLDKKEASTSIDIYEGFGSSHAKLVPLFESLKLHYPNKNIVAIFEPHTFSWRNKNALPWYRDVFSSARDVLIFEPPTHGANTHEQLTLEDIVNEVAKNHNSVSGVHNTKECLNILEQILKKDDIILLVTSGDLGGMIPEIIKYTEQKFPN